MVRGRDDRCAGRSGIGVPVTPALALGPAVTALLLATAAVTTSLVLVLVGTSGAGASVSGTDGPGGTVSVGASDGASQLASPGGLGSGPSTPGADGGPAGSGGTSSRWSCTYTSLLLNDVGGFAPGGPTPGGWYSVTCVDRVSGANTTQTVWIASATPNGGSVAVGAPGVDPRVLALEAERSLLLPRPVLHFSPERDAVVNLATWLWVDRSLWRPLSVTASAGGVSSTAVATPRSVTWSMGDGGVQVCAGPGRPFDLLVPADQQAPTCAYNYRRSSLGQPSPDGNPDDAAFPVRASVTWAVSWTAHGAPGGGELPSLTTTGTADVRVVQVESVNVAVAGANA